MGYVFLTTLMGALGGLMAFAITEPFAPSQFLDPAWGTWQFVMWLVLGGSIGGWLGATLGYVQGSGAHVRNGLLGGLFIGALGGSAGLSIGGFIANLLFGNVLSMPTVEPTTILARVVAFVPLGALIGLVLGIPSRSGPRAVYGLIGGAIGAGIGGITFDAVGLMFGQLLQQIRGGNEVGTLSRGITYLAIGGGIGLFTSIVVRATRTAWVRRVYGRNEFKEWVVDAPQTTIGRSETAHIPVFGDPAVAPIHAVITRHGGNFYLEDAGTPAGTFVNGTPIRQVPLFSGAMIRVGSTDLEFVMRQGSAPAKAAEALRQQWHAQTQPPAATRPAQMAAAVPAGSQTVAIPYQASGFSVVLLTGPVAGQRFLVSGPLEVGREAPGIPIGHDVAASRRHALLDPRPDGVFVTDLGSTNGTFLNGQRIQSGLARQGDLVKVGSTEIRIEQP